MSAALRRSFGSLEIPNYRRYFAGQIVSLSGNWMQMVAEMWLILELTGSGIAVGVTSALQFLPMLLVGAWGGVLADRWPKRRLLVATQATMAVPALGLWALTVTGTVVGITNFVLANRTYGARIDIRPQSAPSVVVSVTHLRADPSLTVGSAVAWSVTVTSRTPWGPGNTCSVSPSR